MDQQSEEFDDFRRHCEEDDQVLVDVRKHDFSMAPRPQHKVTSIQHLGIIIYFKCINYRNRWT